MLYLAQIWIGSLSKLMISDLVMQLHDCCMQLHYFVIYIGKKDTGGFKVFFCNRFVRKTLTLEMVFGWMFFIFIIMHKE